MESDFDKGSRQGWLQALEAVESKLNSILQEREKSRVSFEEALRIFQPGARFQWAPKGVDQFTELFLGLERREAEELVGAVRNTLEELKSQD